MTYSDLIGLAASYAYATGLLVVGEALRRLGGIQPDLTRKLIHIGAIRKAENPLGQVLLNIVNIKQ